MIAPPHLAAEVDRQLELPGWQKGLEAPDVAVWFHRALPAPVIGYRTVTEHAVPSDALVAYLGPNLLGAFSQLNERYAFGDVLCEEPHIVRTGFSMPFPLADREFVHHLVVEELRPGVTIVAYGPADETELASPREGYVRCPIYPSGQRITDLGDGRTRVEHLMTYELGGRISARVQNALFHRGHLGAYRDEWRALVLRTQAGELA